MCCSWSRGARRFGLGAPIGISVGFLNSGRRGGDEGWWRCVMCCVTRFLAIGFDNAVSVVVGCVHEVNQQQGGSNEH